MIVDFSIETNLVLKLYLKANMASRLTELTVAPLKYVNDFVLSWYFLDASNFFRTVLGENFSVLAYQPKNRVLQTTRKCFI